MLYVYI